MITIRYVDKPERQCTQVSELLALLPEVAEPVWVDLFSNDDQQIKALLTALHCHELAIGDTLRHRHPPKIEYFDDQIFILYRGIHQVVDTLAFEHQQIAFFISEKILISVHRQEVQGINKVLQGDVQLLINTPLDLACKIMHLSAGIYLEEILAFDETLAVLEDVLLNAGNDQTLRELTSYQSRLLKLIRTFNYHLSISHCLVTEEDGGLPVSCSPESQHRINDLNDRFERLYSLSRMHYDICGDLINGYLSITSHQLNNTMRVLTVITAIFVPLSFLAGLYGMNFEHIPELHYRYGYFVLLGVMLLLAVGLVWLFKKKRWF